jgi:hypothetical protein
MPTGWGAYPQGAYYPPPVQKPIDVYTEEQKDILETQQAPTFSRMTTCAYCNNPRDSVSSPAYSPTGIQSDCRYCQRDNLTNNQTWN